MRKLFCVLLVTIMLVSLTACSKEEPADTPIQIPADVLNDTSLTPVLPEVQEVNTMTEEEAIAADQAMVNKLVRLLDVAFEYDDWEWDLEDYVLDESFSCYSDSQMTESDVIQDSYPSWRYNPNKLSVDGELYMPNGVMEGLTITFFPVKTENGTELRIREARINEMVENYFIDGKTTKTIYFKDVGIELCNFLCDILGDTIPLQSKTYQNSTFTIFINGDVDREEAFYGLWNGTNITADMKYDIKSLEGLYSENLDNETIRMEKDEMAMGDVCNAIKLAMADEDVYNELLNVACTNNISTYLDVPFEGQYEDYGRIVIQDATDSMPEQYFFSFDGRDEANVEKMFVGGNLTGVTLTFEPYGDCYRLDDVVINKYIRDDVSHAEGRMAGAPQYRGETPDYDAHGILRYLSEDSELYNKLRAVIGDSIPLYSESGKRSEYTVFIGMSIDDSSNVVRVYGQWKGVPV